MQINPFDIIIYIILFSIGLFCGIILSKQFSDILENKFKNAFDKQIKDYNKISNLVLKHHIKLFDDKYDITLKSQDIIDKNFHIINDTLHTLYREAIHLNKLIDKTKELENEIIKLKKIIKRLEKK